MKKAASTLVATCLLSGCSYLTPPFENPIIEQHAQNRINTFAVIPSRRVIIVKSENPAEHQEKRMLVCAEAPADVTDNLASTLAASLAVSGPTTVKGDKAADAAFAVSKTLETYGQFLFKRTQGIQLFRDRSYHLCQARMNGFINDAQYYESINVLFKEVIPLIRDELQYLQHTQPTNTATQRGGVTPPAVSTAAGSATTSITESKIDAKVTPLKPKPEAKPDNGK